MSEIAKDQVNIVFNGDNITVQKDITVTELLQLFEVTTRRLVVLINEQVVPKSTYTTTQLALDDHCDIISAISGG